MGTVTIKDIYAGKLDSRDEEQNKFIASFVTPPGLNIDDLLNGTKHLVSGYKGVGKTSVLRYLQTEAEKRNSQTCTSFIYPESVKLGRARTAISNSIQAKRTRKIAGRRLCAKGCYNPSQA